MRIERGKARLVSRNGKDWTAVFPDIAADLAKLPVRAAWIDGEVVVLDAAGRTSFQALQNALTAKGAPLSFFAFDVIYLDGYDLRAVALTERKRLLRGIVGDGVGAMRVGPEAHGPRRRILRAGVQAGARRRGLQARRFALSRRHCARATGSRSSARAGRRW